MPASHPNWNNLTITHPALQTQSRDDGDRPTPDAVARYVPIKEFVKRPKAKNMVNQG